MDSPPLPQSTRLAILAGARTPQAKAFGALADLTAVELSVHATTAALSRGGLPPERVDEVIMGNVSGQSDSANIARVIALQADIPQDRIAHTVNRNCASAMEAIVGAWQAISAGRSKLIVAGGTESMSQVPMLFSEKAKAKLLAAARAKSWMARMRAYARLRPSDLKPVMGLELGLTDPTCGLNMGQTAEVLADEFAISREAQDAYALDSHHRAVAATERGFLPGEIAPLAVDGKQLASDVGPRPKQSLQQLAKLKPIFRSDGSVTAGNSCPLTDGATSLILCSEQHLAELSDVRPLGFVTGYAIAGCDPRRMGLGPIFAMNRLFRETGLQLSDFDLIEINEAFAAQVLACIQAAASAKFAQEQLGRSTPLGEIERDKLNVNGGAIALGHPVGATGARLVLTLLRSLQERGLNRGLATLCVGGGQGFAVAVEVA